MLYYTSLRTEEGASIECSITFADPANPDPDPPKRIRAQRAIFVPLQKHLPLTVDHLSKLAKALDPWSASIAVHAKDNDENFIWGIADQAVHTNTMFVSEGHGAIVPPGLFRVVIDGAAQLSAFSGTTLIAALRQNRIVTGQLRVFETGPVARFLKTGLKSLRAGAEAEMATKVDSLFPNASPDAQVRRMFDETGIDTLRRILIGMQRYRHGGAILLTGATEHADLLAKYSISYHRIPNALKRLYEERIIERHANRTIYEAIEQNSDEISVDAFLAGVVANGEIADQNDAITGAVRLVSSLCRVDGLVLMSYQLAVLGFGVEILTRKAVASVYRSIDEEGSIAALVPIDPEHYGTRHRSMMRFCNAHKDALGIVISQDGDVRIIKKFRNRLVIWDSIKLLSYDQPPPEARSADLMKRKSPIAAETCPTCGVQHTPETIRRPIGKGRR